MNCCWLASIYYMFGNKNPVVTNEDYTSTSYSRGINWTLKNLGDSKPYPYVNVLYITYYPHAVQ